MICSVLFEKTVINYSFNLGEGRIKLYTKVLFFENWEIGFVVKRVNKMMMFYLHSHAGNLPSGKVKMICFPLKL